MRLVAVSDAQCLLCKYKGLVAGHSAAQRVKLPHMQLLSTEQPRCSASLSEVDASPPRLSAHGFALP